MNKTLKLLLIILFPLGIVYCVCKNLFQGTFVTFVGGVLLFGLGMLLSIYLFAPQLIGL